MASSKNSNTYNRQGWEDSDFPALCQTCLGDNPYIRMTKERFGKECKICARPFTVFRWNPGAKMRFKKTEVCQTCAKLKNVCQTCLLDLEYGLPVQVRDSALKVKDDLPRSDVNKEFYLQNVERQLAGGEDGGALALAGSHGKAQAPSDMLLKLARTTPYYKRNRPHICSFWVKGECKRGEECPYRHEKPTDPDDPLADQNIKDRFYGNNDPVADKLMRRYSAMPKLGLPEDRSITTLYVGNVTDDISEQDLKNHFYQFGEVRSISLVKASQCAFVQFTQRSAAEAAVDKSFNKLIIRGKRLNIKWGKSQAQQQALGRREGEEGVPLEPVPGLPAALPPPPQEVANNFFNLSQPPPPLPLPPGVGPAPTLPNTMMPQAGMPSGLPRGLPPPPPPGLPGMQQPAPPMRPPPMPPRALVHYPSQDPTRMGAIGVKTASEKS